MKWLSLTVALACLVTSFAATARDEHRMFPIKDALETQAAQEKLDPSIKLYFAGQHHPAVIRKIGSWSTNKKTNAFNKSDVEACNWAFLSAMLSLQDRARREGGNAVIDIKSNYKNIETASPTEYMCGAGNIIAGVAFTGTAAKLAK